jgi:ligand-binding sensor domain-containing protein/signal transduction histidine kinase
MVLFQTVQGQIPYYFKHYEVEHGLTNNTVLCSMQDKKGFMWFGTIDGLNRFDGYSFKTFRNDPADAKSLGCNAIYSLYQTADEMIWIGTNKGLYKYNPIDESFELLSSTANQRVKSIMVDDKGTLWFISNYVLCNYTPKTNSFRTFTSRRYEPTSICADKYGNIWVATSTGFLKKYNPANNSFNSFDLFPDPDNNCSRHIEKIYNTNRGTILVGTLNKGIKLFDIKTGTVKDIIIYNHDKTGIFVKDFMQSSENEYWAATENGLFIYNLEQENFVKLKMQYNNSYSLSDNAINTLCKDKEGGIWAGTRFGGISYYPHPYTSFEKYFPQENNNSISGNGVHEIYPDQDGNLWIGTEDAGLNKMDTKTKTFQHFMPDGKKGSISYSNIHGLLITGNELWIGTFEHGLDRMDLKTGKVFKNYMSGASALNSNFIVHLFKTSTGDILVGTWGGLFKYNKANDDFDLIPGFAIQTQSISEDKEGVLWIGTIGNGVYTLDQKTGKTQNFRHDPINPNSLSNNIVNGQYRDAHGNIWFATEGGLCKYEGKNKFKTYTTKNGLPSNFLFKILEDKNNNLWISSTKGLVRFDPQTEDLKVFTTADGLLNDQFNWNSAYKDSSGKMYFGSVKGMISFVPESFSTNTNQPPLYVTGIQVDNKELPIDSKESPLHQSITYTHKITLNHNQSTLSIDFAALSFISPQMNEYAYKMEGLDKDWTYLKTYRKAYFTELSPGNYTFKIKASNSSGVWNEKETILQIEILPPFWASKTAYIFYILGGILLIAVLIRHYHKAISEKNKRRIEQIEHEKENELYKNKIDFFTNIAHEIRTPLTLIQGPMENIISYVDDVPEIKNNLKIMERNTNRLIDIANQLLDFRQTEAKGFSLNFERTDIAELLQDLHNSFQPLAVQHKLNFSLDLREKYFYALADADSVQKILSNLYSNAIKYADKNVGVKFIPLRASNKFRIEIRNDGFLIPYELHDKIFEPFYRIKETTIHKGTGIGLAISRTLAELNKGTLVLIEPENGMNVFILELMINNEEAIAKVIVDKTIAKPLIQNV